MESIAGGLIYRATHELPLDEPTRAAHRYLQLTAEQVQAAFAKWGVVQGGEASGLDWPDDWSEHLRKIIFKQNAAALRTHRIVRFYEANTLIIVKPDRLRDWIASTAIRDADETLIDLQEQGF